VFLMIFTLLGFAAGVQTMVRSAREIQKQAEADEAARKKD
jgi:ATP synthase protein I